MKRGQKILINGGGGGVGFFALQLAKEQNAEVTGVDTGEKLGMMKEMGYDHIIDYKQTDFTKGTQQYDLILDCRTSRSPFAFSKALKSDGKYVTVGGRTGKLLTMLFFKPWFALFSKKRFHLVGLKANKDLAYINELYEAGKIKCQIDGPYGFEKIPWAVRRFGEALHSGKVVISVNPVAGNR